MTRTLTLLGFVACSIVLPLSLDAQGFYISTDIGLGFGRSLSTNASDSDFPTLCDRYLDPENLFSPVGITEPDGCSSAASTWSNSFDSSTGLVSAVAIGFATRYGVRIESEYYNFRTHYDAISSVDSAGSDLQDKLNQEFLRAEERIGEANIDNVFVNAYYDVHLSGKFRPYAGGGVGLGTAAIDYDGVFARNLKPEAIKTGDGATYNGDGNENADRQALHERIAGTTSTASHTLKDTVFGYQAMVGVDYMLSENASIGIKGRWVRYPKFSGSNEWDQIRSHSSNNGPGTHTVTYTIATDDLSGLGVSLALKYRF